MTDVASVARGLTKAQRKAFAAGYCVKGVLNALEDLGLASGGFVASRGRAWYVHFTPLGLAVRDYLKGQNNDA